MLFDMTKAAAFTGSRPKMLCEYNDELYKKFVTEDMQEFLDKFIKTTGTNTFLTGGAQGIDQLAFWAVDLYKNEHPEKALANIVVVPYGNQSEKWSEHGVFGKNEYRMMLERADTVFTLHNGRLTDKRLITEALLARNTWLTDHSTITIGMRMFDEDIHNDYAVRYEIRHGRGGTLHTLRESAKRRHPIYLVHLETGPYLHIEDTAVLQPETPLLNLIQEARQHITPV